MAPPAPCRTETKRYRACLREKRASGRGCDHLAKTLEACRKQWRKKHRVASTFDGVPLPTASPQVSLLMTQAIPRCFGVYTYPTGWVSSMNFVRFRACGKQFEIQNRRAREPMFVMVPGRDLIMRGVAVTEPLTGHFTRCKKMGENYRGSDPEGPLIQQAGLKR